jgi:hypothetical protein
MPNSKPDTKRVIDLKVVIPLLLELRDSLGALSLGLHDVLFELDEERQRESAAQANLLLERARVSSLEARRKPG